MLGEPPFKDCYLAAAAGRSAPLTCRLGLAGRLVERRRGPIQRASGEATRVADDHGHDLERPATGRRAAGDVRVDPILLAVGAGHAAARPGLVWAGGGAGGGGGGARGGGGGGG